MPGLTITGRCLFVLLWVAVPAVSVTADTDTIPDLGTQTGERPPVLARTVTAEIQ